MGIGLASWLDPDKMEWRGQVESLPATELPGLLIRMSPRPHPPGARPTPAPVLGSHAGATAATRKWRRLVADAEATHAAFVDLPQRRSGKVLYWTVATGAYTAGAMSPLIPLFTAAAPATLTKARFHAAHHRPQYR